MTTPPKLVRETSAGGVVLRRLHGKWHIAVIEPNQVNADAVTRRAKARPGGVIFALPKGGIDHGESAEQADERVSKTVTFFLFHYDSGVLGQIRPEMKIEVRRAVWIPLAHAPSALTYRGERETAMAAQRYLRMHPLRLSQLPTLADEAVAEAEPTDAPVQ